jgi:hypothetical protein
MQASGLEAGYPNASQGQIHHGGVWLLVVQESRGDWAGEGDPLLKEVPCAILRETQEARCECATQCRHRTGTTWVGVPLVGDSTGAGDPEEFYGPQREGRR